MKHTIQFGVQTQPDGSVQIRVECTCGEIFATDSVKAVTFNYTSRDVKARLWREAKESANAHIAERAA